MIESEGMQIDNDQKRRKPQHEAYAELINALEDEESAEEPVLLQEFEAGGLDERAANSVTRRGFLDACPEVVAPPVQLLAESSERDLKRRR